MGRACRAHHCRRRRRREHGGEQIYDGGPGLRPGDNGHRTALSTRRTAAKSQSPRRTRSSLIILRATGGIDGFARDYSYGASHAYCHAAKCFLSCGRRGIRQRQRRPQPFTQIGFKGDAGYHRAEYYPQRRRAPASSLKAKRSCKAVRNIARSSFILRTLLNISGTLG